MADAASTILLRAGVLGPQSLAAATALKQREGGTLGEALVRLGLIDEDRLVGVFRDGLLVPVVAPADLSRISAEVLRTVPARMAAEYRVIPVEIDQEGNLTLAMADPTDNRAVDAVAAHSGRFVMRAVAAPTAVRSALLSLYSVSLTGARPSSSPQESKAQPAPAAKPANKRNTLPPTEMVVPEAAMPVATASGSVLSALARAVDQGQDAGGKGRKSKSSKPAIAAVTTQEIGDGKTPRANRTQRRSAKLPTVSASRPGPAAPAAVPEELLAPVALLQAAADRDEVVSVLLDFAGRLAARVGLFVVQKGQLACLDGRGPDHVVVAMKWFTIPVDTPSPFRDVLQSRQAYIGSLADKAESRAFRSALGSTSGDLLLLPLLVGDKAVGVLYADEIKEDLGRLSRELETLSREAGGAFARIILSAKKK